MAGRRFIYCFWLLMALGFYIAYQEWVAWIFLLVVLIIPWLSLLISLPGILAFRARAAGPQSIPLGARGTTALEGTSRFPVPPFSGRLRVKRCTTDEQWVYKQDVEIRAEHCGGLLVTPEKVRIYDYLGLFRFPVRKCGDCTILVRPEKAPTSALPGLRRHTALRWKPKPGGGFAENHELRLYRPGDSLNQLHWKLTAKTGKLMIREPMEPSRGRFLLTMDLNGSARELDEKFARLLGASTFLLTENISHEIQVLTAGGISAWSITREADCIRCIDALLCSSPVVHGSIRDSQQSAAWVYHIGGEPGEV